MAQGRTKFLYPSGSKPLEGYTIKRGIGVGGFGEVYFALSDAGKEVALKRIQRNLDIELRGVRQCLNLKHVNLISLWDIRTNAAGESWVVMEYVPGKSLRDMVELYPEGMPEDQVKTWFASTAAGTAYLHSRGIVHRDLKPGNIFCDEDAQVIKIGDYGLSKFISCSRRSGQTESVGTFHYMAPEIGKGVYGKEIDVYAMGIILFEMLTGRVPFDGESSQEIIMKHLTAEPNLDGLPEQFEKAVRGCLVKDPDERYSSIPELLQDLPWEDLAKNSQEIVNRHSIGPIGTNPVISAAKEQPVETESRQAAAEVKPMLLRQQFDNDDSAEIVFGELRDSRYESNGYAHNGHRAPDVSVVSATIPTQGRPPASPQPVPAVMINGGTASIKRWFTEGKLPTPLKVFIVAVLGILIVVNNPFVLTLALGIGLLYLSYYVFQAWIKTESSTEMRTEVTEQSNNNLSKVRTHLGLKDFGDHCAELLGSMLLATLVSLVVCSVAFLIGDTVFSPSIESVASYVWLTLTSCVGSWALLLTSKSWEHRNGNAWSRRGVMVGIGALVGIAAFGIAAVLGVDLNLFKSNGSTLGSNAIPQFVVPIFPAYLIFFTVMFGILRWWRQVDPARETRFSLWVVGLCLVWSVVLSHLLGFDPVWNGIIAIATTVSTQIAAPWLNPSLRSQIHQSSVA